MGTLAANTPTSDGFERRLREYEWRLFRAIALSRVAVVLAVGAIVPDERSVHGTAIFTVIVVAWAGALVWVVAPLPWIRGLHRRLRDRPQLVLADVAALAVLLAAGGGWRNPFYLYAWSPFGLASVVWPARRTLLLVAAGCGLQVASFAAWSGAGSDPATRHVAVSAWVSPLVGYVVVGGLFAYVRRRFDDLSDAAAAYARRAAEAIAAARRAAVAAENEEVAYALHRRLRQVFPALGLRLAALAPEAVGDDALLAEFAAVSAIAAEADTALDAVMTGLARQEPDGTGRPGTFRTGPTSARFLG